MSLYWYDTEKECEFCKDKTLDGEAIGSVFFCGNCGKAKSKTE